jgi:hypothetical protein
LDHYLPKSLHIDDFSTIWGFPSACIGFLSFAGSFARAKAVLSASCVVRRNVAHDRMKSCQNRSGSKMGISPRKMWAKWEFHHEKCGENVGFTMKNGH